VLCKSCFFDCKSLTSVTFEPRSKLRIVTGDSFRGSLYHYLIEYQSSVSERSRAAILQDARVLFSSIAHNE
jgi:hypothetical protein